MVTFVQATKYKHVLTVTFLEMAPLKHVYTILYIGECILFNKLFSSFKKNVLLFHLHYHSDLIHKEQTF